MEFHTRRTLLSLLFLGVLCLSMIVSTTAVDRMDPINCRKYVHMPICRGVAAKRDTRRLNEQERTLSLEDIRELPVFSTDSNEKISITRSFFISLLRRAFGSQEYDTGTDTNYIKK